MHELIKIYFFDLLFSHNGEPIAFLWDFLAVTVWFVSGLVFLCIIEGVSQKEIGRFPRFFFLVYFVTLPYTAGQMMAFSMSSFPVATGILATAFSVDQTLKWIEKREKQNIGLAVLLLMYGVSIYQAILGVYITAIVMICLIKALSDNNWNWRLIWNSAMISILACIIFELLSILFTFVFKSDNQSYLTENFIGWTEDPNLLHALFMAVANVARVSFGITIQDVNIYGGSVICIASIGFILCAIFLFLHAKKKGQKFKIFIFSVALMLAPFTIYLCLGTYKTQGRMLLGLCLSGAFQYLVILYCLKNKKILHYLSIIVLIYVLFLNLSNTNRIYYYDYLRYSHDKVIANEVMYDIRRENLDYHQKALVFVGMLEPEVGENVRHDSLGFRGSYFRWDDGNIGRINKFLTTEGYQVVPPSTAQIQEAIKYIGNMPNWPLDGGIVETENMIIIKLSEPTEKWYRINGVAPIIEKNSND